MIEYVFEKNPDERILQRASRVLNSGGLVCFPTETNWVACASPFHKEGVDKLYRLRHVENTKHFTIMCSSFQKAMEIAVIGNGAFSILKKIIPGPYTFIFESQKKITKWLKASKVDHQVGIRFSPSVLCQKLLETHGEVLICTHVTQDMLGEEDATFIYSALIEDALGSMIDLIIDPGEAEFLGPTTIIDWTTGEPEIIREGSGSTSLFKR